MYGLVNKYLQDMIVARYGSAQWDKIREISGTVPMSFVTMSYYPDELSYKLVGSASSVLGIPPEQILFSFGDYWVDAVEQSYGEMLAFAGDNLVDFLKNLDNMHARVGLSFPAMKPPSFRCTDITDSSLRLHYYSGRSGLSPLVEGLLVALGKRFSLAVDVVHDKSKAAGEDHDEFVVNFRKV